MTEIRADQTYVVATVDCEPHHVGQVGGKAVGLGSLLRAGQRVPASFVVSAGAYADWVASEPRRATEPARRAIEAAYQQLSEPHGAAATVAVRSSATIEDSSEASCAGQFRSFLGARGAAEVVAQVEQCWESAFAPHVSAYRTDRRLDERDGVAVIVQELVDARVAGVMFTQHPRTGDRSLVVIESSYGLGEAVVGGEVTPDLFEVNKITRQVHHRSLGSKPHEHRLTPGSHSVETLPVDPDRQSQWSIDESEIMALVALASDLESKLGRGLDVEWAVGTVGSGAGSGADSRPGTGNEEAASEDLFALQVRPITVDRRHRGIETGPQTDAIDFILGRLSGKSAS